VSPRSYSIASTVLTTLRSPPPLPLQAGITYLYSLWNVALGNIDDPPSLNESMMDIQSCSSVLQALSFNVSSSAACRETFELLSTAVLKRLTDENANPEASPNSGGAAASNVAEENVTSNGNNLTLASSSMDGISAFPQINGQANGAYGSTCGPAAHDGESTAAPSPAPAPLPRDLQGLDDLFLNPLGAHMGWVVILKPSACSSFHS
jgi:hypothetical protein